jgi:hypothetical protein
MVGEPAEILEEVIKGNHPDVTVGGKAASSMGLSSAPGTMVVLPAAMGTMSLPSVSLVTSKTIVLPLPV